MLAILVISILLRINLVVQSKPLEGVYQKEFCDYCKC